MVAILMLPFLALMLLPEVDRYQWRKVREASAHVIWQVVTRADLHTICGVTPAQMPTLLACALQINETDTCTIYSRVTEIEAALDMLHRNGENMSSHERKHCEGYSHQLLYEFGAI